MNLFKKIASDASVIAFVAIVFASSAVYASAQTNVFTQPFGGPIISYVVPTPLCPFAHTVVFNYATFTPIGIAMVPGSLLYSFYNLVKPGSFVLGTHVSTPLPCVLPYAIFPISQVGTSE